MQHFVFRYEEPVNYYIECNKLIFFYVIYICGLHIHIFMDNNLVGSGITQTLFGTLHLYNCVDNILL